MVQYFNFFASCGNGRDNSYIFLDHPEPELLFDASCIGDVKQMKRLLKRMSRAARISGSSRGLREAAKYNCEDAIKLLLNYGGSVNEQNVNGETALHCAARYNNAKATQLLLENGADINIRNYNNQTPLGVAGQESSADVIQLLTRK